MAPTVTGGGRIANVNTGKGFVNQTGVGKPTQLLIEERADMWAFLVDALQVEVEIE